MSIPETLTNLPVGCAEQREAHLSRTIPCETQEDSALQQGLQTWQILPLGEVIQLEYGKSLTAKERDETGSVVVYGSSGDVGRHNESYIDDPCIIVGRKGNVGNVYITKGPCWPIDTVYFVKRSYFIELKYLFYHLLHLNLSKLDKSTAIPGLNRNDAYKQLIRIYPLNQQKIIVAKIEELFSHIDAGIAALQKSKKLLKQYRQSVLKAAVTGELTREWREHNKDKLEPASNLLKRIEIARQSWIDVEIQRGNSEAKRLNNKLKKHDFIDSESLELPDQWIYISLLTLCQLVVDCHNKTAPYVDNGIPLIRTSNVRDGKIIFDEKMKYVDQETYEYWSKRCPPKSGDILFTREAPMGEVAIIPENKTVCMGQRMMLLRVFHDLVDVNYLLLALMDPSFFKQLQKFKVGVGVQHLRVGDVEKLTIALPPLLEQKEIFKIADEKLNSINRLELEISCQLLKAEKNKQSILAAAFSGRLKNTDNE